MGETVTTAPRTSPSTSTGSAITSGRAVPRHLQRRRLRAAPGERGVEPLAARRVERSGRRRGADGANGDPSAVTTCTDTP